MVIALSKMVRFYPFLRIQKSIGGLLGSGPDYQMEGRGAPAENDKGRPLPFFGPFFLERRVYK
jgi:hypothetical protein